MFCCAQREKRLDSLENIQTTPVEGEPIGFMAAPIAATARSRSVAPPDRGEGFDASSTSGNAAPLRRQQALEKTLLPARALTTFRQQTSPS